MHSGGRTVRWNRQLSLQVGVVLAAIALFVPLDHGSVVDDVPEILVPLVVAAGLLSLAAYLRRLRFAPGERERIVKFGWLGAFSAGTICTWWVVLHLVRELPVGRLGDQLVTVWSLGIGTGVLVGIYTARRRSTDRGRVHGSVLAETTWTDRAEPAPVTRAIVEEIAELEGEDPLEVDPLFEHVDPDVFEELRAHDDSHWQLLFYTDDYEIRVSSQGTITVFDADPSGAAVAASE